MSSEFYYKKVGNLMYSETPPSTLGKGGFATVFKGFLTESSSRLESGGDDEGASDHNQKEVAVKRISLYDDPRAVQAELLFFELSQNMHHENIIRYLAKEDDDEYLYIAMDLCAITLEELVRMSRSEMRQFTPGPDVEILRQTTAGLHYLHSKKIVHLDLKPQNILITDRRVVKLSDFGLCQMQKDGADDGFTYRGAAGTEGWKAPEFYNGSIERFGYSADIFSLGCVFGYTMTGKHPFGDIGPERVKNIKNGKLDWKRSVTIENWELKRMIIKMVSSDPCNRPSFEVILFKLVERLLAYWRAYHTGLQFHDLYDETLSEKNLTTAELMDRLIKTMTLTNYDDCKGKSILLLICQTFKKTRLECVEKLFSCEHHRFKLNVNGTDVTSNHNALTYVLENATEDDNDTVELAELLIKNGINVDVKTTNGDTALGLAIKYFSRPGSPDRGLVDMVKLLLDHGADTNVAPNKDGWSPITLACRYYHKDDLIDVLNLLIDKGARLDRSTPGGNDAFVYVRQYYQGTNRAAINSLLVEASQTSANAIRG